MSNPLKYLSGSLDPSSLMDTYNFKRDFRKKHPDYFDPDGILCFCGSQGQGKTLSMVQYALRLAKRYPDMICVSNVEMPVFPDSSRLIMFSGMVDLIDKFRNVSNGYGGVLYGQANGGMDSWASNSGTFTDSGSVHTGNEWIQVKLPAAKVVRSFDLYERGDLVASGYAIDFSLLASNDGNSWITLGSYTRSGVPAVVYEKKSYTVDSQDAYLYYRLLVTKCSDQLVTIGDLCLYGGNPETTDPEPPPDPPPEPEQPGGIGGGGVSPPPGGGTVSPEYGSAAYSFTREGLYDLASLGLAKISESPSTTIAYLGGMSDTRYYQDPRNTVSPFYVSSDFEYTLSYTATYTGSLGGNLYDSTLFAISPQIASMVDWYELGGNTVFKRGLTAFTVRFRPSVDGVIDFSYRLFPEVWIMTYQNHFIYGNGSTNPPTGMTELPTYVLTCTLEVVRTSDDVLEDVSEESLDMVDDILENDNLNQADEIQGGIGDIFLEGASGSAELIFPGFNMSVGDETHQIWEDQTFDLRRLDEWMPALMGPLRIVLVGVVYLLLVRYAQAVVKNIMGEPSISAAKG